MAELLGGMDGAIDSWLANRKQNGWRAVGGTLSLFADGLVFKPNVVDKVLAGDEWHVHFSEVKAVGKADVQLGDLFSGGLRTRLRIDLVDGRVELFVVGGLDNVIQTLNRFLAPAL